MRVLLTFGTIDNDYCCYLYKLGQKCLYNGLLEYKNALFRNLVPQVCVLCMISNNSTGHGNLLLVPVVQSSP